MEAHECPPTNALVRSDIVSEFDWQGWKGSMRETVSKP
jgi:hypothetical protein